MLPRRELPLTSLPACGTDCSLVWVDQGTRAAIPGLRARGSQFIESCDELF